MKSTYKLYGIFWDHRPLATINKWDISGFSHFFDYRTDFCLFDFLEEYRTIKISELLSVNSDKEWSQICSYLSLCENVAIVIDYIPLKRSIASSAFYRRRVRQIYYVLQHEFAFSKLIIQVPLNCADNWYDVMAIKES